MPKNTRGQGKITIIKNKDKIMELYNQGFDCSYIYDEIEALHFITKRNYYYQIKKLYPELLAKKEIASSDFQESEKAVDKTDEKPRRLTTKEKMVQGLLDSSDKPSFVHNRIPKPEELL